MVGKYTELSDAYLSVIKALQHACLAASRRLRIDWIEASNLEETTAQEDPTAHTGAPYERAPLRQRAALTCRVLTALSSGCCCADAWSRLRSADGVLVPGGFGSRGVEGKVAAANYARLNDKPYLGICLGLQARAALCCAVHTPP